MTDEQASLTPAQLATAFPFHLTLDHETRIRAVGLSIGRVLGEHAVGRPFAELFRFTRPHITGTSAEMKQQAGRLVVIESLAEPRIHLRGSILPAEGDVGFFLLLSPWITRLDDENEPVREPNVGTVHFGHTPLVRELRVVPLVQAGTLGLALLAALVIFRTRAHADRERVWAGMARESAHQLGTPLSSLSGWIELLRDREMDALTTRALDHMQGDLERLERVAHRFERIGRPPKREAVDVGLIVQRVSDYFRARVPSLAHAVTIETYIHEGPLIAQGDPVLVEWVLEALIKNAIDALAGNGGRVRLGVKRTPENIQLMVADDGPGIPRENRKRIFEPGFSTKQHGWGLGLALTRRIVEESHGGTLTLLPTERGAVFQITLPA